VIVLRVRLASLSVAVLLAAAATSAYAGAGSGSRPNGPDVASFQHPAGAAINWQRVHSAGASFAFVKATEGSTYTNPYFTQDYAAVHKAGMIRSAYHYARPRSTPTSARDQAKAFVKVAGVAGSRGDLPLTLDLEETGGLNPAQLVSWTQSFVAEVKTLTHRTTILYTYPYFWQHAMGNSTAFTSLPLWLASYRSGGPRTPLPGGWKSWTFWQYTAMGTTPGIRGSVDESLFSGSSAQLNQLANPTAHPVTGPIGPLPIPLPVALPKTLPHLPSHAEPPTGHANLGP